MELKDVLSYLGADKEFKDINEFKEYFDPAFIRKDIALKDDNFRKQVTGTAFMSVGQNLRKGLKEKYELEIPNSELENSQLEDFVFGNIEKIKGSYEAKIKDLEAKITTPNEALKDIESKYSTLEKRYKEQVNATKALESEYTGYKENSVNEMKNFKINLHKKDMFGKIKFKSDISEIEKIGFDNLLTSKYKLDIDETGETLILDSKGNRIQNEKVAGKFKTPLEVFEDEAIANNLISVNQHEGVKPNKKQIATFVGNNTAQSANGNVAQKVFFTSPR